MMLTILTTNQMTSKTTMFIDFQKQGGGLEFSFNRMDINDVKIISDALEFALTQYVNDEQEPFEVKRIKSIQAELKDNIYTQNIRLPLIPIVKVNPFACYGNKEPHIMDFECIEDYNDRIQNYRKWEANNK